MRIKVFEYKTHSIDADWVKLLMLQSTFGFWDFSHQEI